MKGLSYILMVYLILLAVVPCCAFDDCTDIKGPKQQSELPGGKNDDCGACSPFFNCEKCASVSINIETVFLNIVETQAGPSYTGFIPRHITAVYYDFWQPPRLA